MGYRFSTEEVRPCDRLEAWQQAVQDSCVPMAICSAAGAGEFAGSLASREIGDLCLSLVQANRHAARHGRPEVARTQGDYLLVSMQIAGHGLFEQAGETAEVGPGDFIAYDSRRDYRWVIPDQFRQLVLRVPGERLRRLGATPERAAPRAFSCRAGVGRIAFDHFSSLFAQADTLAGDVAPYLLDGALALLAGTLADAFDEAGPRSRLQALHLRQAYAFIGEQLCNPELSPEAIAGHLRISVRYLHNLFSGEAHSVGRYILHRRLAGCARSLQDPRLAGRSISEIAFAWGFNNSAHFTRVFRGEFGASPREYRRSPSGATVPH